MIYIIYLNLKYAYSIWYAKHFGVHVVFDIMQIPKVENMQSKYKINRRNATNSKAILPR